MPPQHGMWIPPTTEHHVRMVGAVSAQSLYVELDAVPSMSAHCQVVGILPFMRSLITEALDLLLEYELGTRNSSIMGSSARADAARKSRNFSPIAPFFISSSVRGRLAYVKQLTLNQRVQGSSPCAPTNLIKYLSEIGRSRFDTLYRPFTDFVRFSFRSSIKYWCHGTRVVYEVVATNPRRNARIDRSPLHTTEP